MWVSQDALFRLEPYVGKLTCTVLRGTCSLVTGFWGGNAPRLLGFQVGFFDFFLFPLEGKKSKNPTQLLPLPGLAKFRLNNYIKGKNSRTTSTTPQIVPVTLFVQEDSNYNKV
jgi:hypothetical protein